MSLIRWIISLIISPLLLIPLYLLISWILEWVYRIFIFIIFWGTRYDMPHLFSFEKQVEDLKSFILITCISTIISSGLSGLIGGIIAPSNNPKILGTLYAIIILPITIYSSVIFWNNEHWFYSTLWVIDMLIVAFVFIASAITINDEKGLSH